MFSQIRKSKISRYVSFFLALNILAEIITPSVAYGLTSGPAQEEFASFEPSSTSDMVELYSGDFNYNIPLLSVPGPNGGYPINIAYHSGIGMEQEASWVGLGWTLNVGAVSRQMQGLPDDFNGDVITKKQHIRKSVTVGLDIPSKKAAYKEFAGVPPPSENKFSANWQVYYNNFKGIGIKSTISPRISKGTTESAPANLNLSFDSQNGIGIGISFKVNEVFKNSDLNAGFGLGLNYNSRSGLQSVNFTSSVKASGNFNSIERSKDSKDHEITTHGSGKSASSLSFNTAFGVPSVNMQTKSTTVPFNLKIGKADKVFKFTSNFTAMWSGYVYTSQIANDGIESYPAFGYNYTNNGTGDNAMKDFNRQSIAYNKKIPHLPTSNFTYDLFTQTGQGTGSMFRSHLNTFGILNDPRKISEDKTINAGLEAGLGGAAPSINVHVGIDFELGLGQNSSGAWSQIKNNPDLDPALSNLKNWSATNTNFDYEQSYFKVIGEKTGILDIDNQLNDFAGDDAIRLKIEKEKNDDSWINRHFKASNQLVKTETSAVVATIDGSNQTVQKGKRIKRSTSISALDGYQKSVYGFSSYLGQSGGQSGSHIAEISILQDDGMRYVYGLPAYNKKQIDNVFSVKSNGNFNQPDINIIESNGEVDYKNTYEEFLSKNEIPSYVHSWMLSSVLSSDYLDLTGNGPSDDDYGYWVKFNYVKVADDFKWKMPYTKANFMEGYRNQPNDDKASYTYGTKEIYFLESIETKTHKAVFITSDRRDGIEAPGEYNNSGIGSQHMKKLDKIQLFTKRELNTSNPTPTKVVNFEYSYDLCPNVPNNDLATENQTFVNENGVVSTTNVNAKGGKLTLKKLFFTYENSTRSALSPYIFDYGNINDFKDNPVYNKRNIDRWGNFKNNSANYSSNTNIYPFIDFPYTDQDPDYYSSQNGLNPAQWSLKKIFLPTGGTLKIDYEFDDYSSVENNRPTRMFDIMGIGDDAPAIQGSIGTPGIQSQVSAGRNANYAAYAPTEARVLSNPSISNSSTNTVDDSRIYFKLEKPIPQSNSNIPNYDPNSVFYNQYMLNLPSNQLFFKVFAHLKDQYYDYFQGYAEIETYSGTYGVANLNGTNYTHGYISLKQVPLAKINVTGIKVNPITRAAIEHISANRSEVLNSFQNPYSNSALTQIGNLVGALPGLLGELEGMIMGFNNKAFKDNLGKSIQLNGLSVIRLCDPDDKKIGGGVRVKKISLDDNWVNNPLTPNNQNNDADPLNNNALYGQEYYYDTNGDGTGKTTGVAYEPQLGSEESSLKTPINYKVSTPLKGDKHLFMENPIMESYYPGASVGYAKVTVKSIAPDRANKESNGSNNLNYSAAPVTVNEFFTPKDFPVIFDKTDMNPGQPITIPIMVPGFFTSMKKRQAKSQGYSVILNDMAGKPKAITVLTRNGGQQISKQSFIYNTTAPYSENRNNKLSNKVQVIDINDNYQTVYQTGIVGQTHDMFIDMHEDAQESNTYGLNLNLDINVPGFFIMPIPTVQKSSNSMRTVVFNKIIHRTGILMKTITTDQESTITTENLAFDIETGEPILTKTFNEFKDPIYNFSYAGHWYYNSMKGSYKNDQLTIKAPGNNNFITSNSSNGTIPVASYIPSNTNILDYYTKGDLLYIDCVNDLYDGQYTLFSINTANKSLHCINYKGEYFPANEGIISLSVVKSGFKNLQSTKVGSLAFKNLSGFSPYNHLNANNATNGYQANAQYLTIDNSSNHIINANAVEYSDDWQVLCSDVNTTKDECKTVQSRFGLDYITVLNNLLQSGNFPTVNLVLYDNTNGNNLYNNGFTPYMANFRPSLLYGQPVDKVKMLFATRELDNNNANYGKYAFLVYYEYQGVPLFFHELSLTVPPPASIYSFEKFQKETCGENPYVYSYLKLNTGNGIALDDNVTFNEYLQIINNGNPITITNKTLVSDIQIPINQFTCGANVNYPVNPYMVGMKGQWRPKASYAFKTERTQTNNTRNDGVFADYVRFPWENSTTKDVRWINASTITKYSPYGFELENKDALGNYSSALYGYKHSLAVAVSQNAKYNEIGFDSFEDYPTDCNEKHFKFTNYFGDVSSLQAHSGKYSLKVLGGNSPIIEKSIHDDECSFNGINDNYNIYISNPDSIQFNSKRVAHKMRACDCIGEFAPIKGKKYVVSAWVKQTSTGGSSYWTTYNGPKINVKVNGSTIATFSSKRNIIDGWQQIFETYTVPTNATSVAIELVNTAGNGDVCYFDDIRIHPNDANMVTYVYNPTTLKTVAELDANNYATFYVYDNEGKLNKVKKETSEGIKTIKEGRINNKKINE